MSRVTELFGVIESSYETPWEVGKSQGTWGSLILIQSLNFSQLQLPNE